MRTAAVVALALALLVVACGADDGGGSQEAASAASPTVDLRIRIAASAREGAPTRLWRLRCEPAGGDWPSVGPACRRLSAKVLAPIEFETKDFTRITRQPVRVTGRAFGKAVSLRFPAMGSSGRRARLRALRSALGSSAFSEAERRSR